MHIARVLGAEIGAENFYVKFEGPNPTSFFKDRGMIISVSHIRELGGGAKMIGCASTGNTTSILAAYLAKVGMKCVVFSPQKGYCGEAGIGVVLRSQSLSIDGNFNDVLILVRNMADEKRLYLLNSINPYRLEGQKFVLFEIIDQLQYNVPDRIILPVGNVANI